jgi:hypothetical protein
LKTAAAAVILLMMPAGVLAQPKVLSNSELDAITAAGILVEVDSFSMAIGDVGRARTDAKTFAFGGRYVDLGVGITRGQALACCGEEADVEVGSEVLGIGDLVQGVTHAVEHDGLLLAFGLSAGLVIAVSFDDRPAMLRGLRPGLADFRDSAAE